MISVLDERLTAHNSSAKPEIRLRGAVHLGPSLTERGFHRPNIDVSRLLDATVFKQVVRHCREHITADAFTTALSYCTGCTDRNANGNLVDPTEA